MKSIRTRLHQATVMILSVLIGAAPVSARSAVAQEIEQAFQRYTEKMGDMTKVCQKQDQEEALACMCGYMGELFALKALVEQAAKTAPDDKVTFRAQGKSESVTLGKLAKDMQKTEKMAAMCENPSTTVKKLTAFKAEAMHLNAKTMLRNIHSQQKIKATELGRFVGFSTNGAGTNDCEIDELNLKILSCNKTAYSYSAKVSKDGQSFTAEARTRTGKDHGIFPGCKTPDIWTIDEKGSIRHVLNAAEKC